MRLSVFVEALEFVRARLGVAIIEAQEGEIDAAAEELARAAEKLQESLEELRS